MCITHRSRYENKGAQPPAKTLTDIADALKLSPDFLLYGSAEQKANVKLSDPELIKQFKAIEAMEEEDRNVVKKLIDALLLKQIQKRRIKRPACGWPLLTLNINKGY